VGRGSCNTYNKCIEFPSQNQQYCENKVMMLAI
jgi:hypothetical protein